MSSPEGQAYFDNNGTQSQGRPPYLCVLSFVFLVYFINTVIYSVVKMRYIMYLLIVCHYDLPITEYTTKLINKDLKKETKPLNYLKNKK